VSRCLQHHGWRSIEGPLKGVCRGRILGRSRVTRLTRGVSASLCGFHAPALLALVLGHGAHVMRTRLGGRNSTRDRFGNHWRIAKCGDPRKVMLGGQNRSWFDQLAPAICESLLGQCATIRSCSHTQFWNMCLQRAAPRVPVFSEATHRHPKITLKTRRVGLLATPRVRL